MCVSPFLFSHLIQALMVLCSFCTVTCLTLIYGVVVWWGVVDFATAMQLALAEYFFKAIIALIDTPFIYFARDWDVSDKDWVASKE